MDSSGGATRIFIGRRLDWAPTARESTVGPHGCAPLAALCASFAVVSHLTLVLIDSSPVLAQGGLQPVVERSSQLLQLTGPEGSRSGSSLTRPSPSDAVVVAVSVRVSDAQFAKGLVAGALRVADAYLSAQSPLANIRLACCRVRAVLLRALPEVSSCRSPRCGGCGRSSVLGRWKDAEAPELEISGCQSSSQRLARATMPLKNCCSKKICVPSRRGGEPGTVRSRPKSS